MGHLVGKELYRKLGKKIDNLTVRVPWNEKFYNILVELYTPDEAEVCVKMPFGMTDFDHIRKSTGFEQAKLQKILDSLSVKGLILDIWNGKKYLYMLSPLVIGIFEMTMMRTGANLNTSEWARLFNDYLEDKSSFYKANLEGGKKVMPLRAMPHNEAIDKSEAVEIFDYENAKAILESNDKFAIGICSCRHEKLHTGQKSCDVPLETCSSFGSAAEYMIRREFAKEVSKTEMLENLARSKELGLVICADNVKKDVSFFCFCCGCCCNVLLGISKFGYPNAVVTSSMIIKRDEESCSQCEVCIESCPINAITMQSEGCPKIDESICMGCGVCALNCSAGALRLVKRGQRVLHPETMFERVILQCLERGTLQNFMFTDTQRLTHKFMRGFVGGFLKMPPVKKALMSDTLRSSFLHAMQRK